MSNLPGPHILSPGNAHNNLFRTFLLSISLFLSLFFFHTNTHTTQSHTHSLSLSFSSSLCLSLTHSSSSSWKIHLATGPNSNGLSRRDSPLGRSAPPRSEHERTGSGQKGLESATWVRVLLVFRLSSVSWLPTSESFSVVPPLPLHLKGKLSSLTWIIS